MKMQETWSLAKFFNEEKIAEFKQEFLRAGVIDKDNPETVWIERMVDGPESNIFEDSRVPEQIPYTFEKYLIESFHFSKSKYSKEIEQKLKENRHRHNDFLNLIELYRDDLESLLENQSSAEYFQDLAGLKKMILEEIKSIILKLDKLDYKSPNLNLDENKIKFNLSKKEVCILFEYLHRENLISGANSQEELAILIEKHAMYKSKDNYHFITNAKNTLSKIKKDDAHKTPSPTLLKHLKLYK